MLLTMHSYYVLMHVHCKPATIKACYPIPFSNNLSWWSCILIPVSAKILGSDKYESLYQIID